MPKLQKILSRSLCSAAILLSPTTVLAQATEHAPVALDSADELAQDKPKSESWTYAKPGLNTASYKQLMIEPTAVYDGPDAQFDGIDPKDRKKFAEIMTKELREELAKSISIVDKPAANTMRLQVTILGAEKTKGGLATATRLTTFGLVSSAFKSATDKPGTMTGSLLVAVELYDASNGELLLAAVRRRTPDALDIPATLSTSDTMKAIARDFAKTAGERLEKLNEKGAAGMK